MVQIMKEVFITIIFVVKVSFGQIQKLLKAVLLILIVMGKEKYLKYKMNMLVCIQVKYLLITSME